MNEAADQSPRAPADAVHEVLDQLPAGLGVDDFGVELHAVDRLIGGGDGGDRSVLGVSDRAETVGKPREVVAVAHPHRRAVGDVTEEIGLFVDDEMGAAELAAARALDGPAEFVRNRLQAVADPEDRHKAAVARGEREEFGVEVGRALVVDGVRAAGEDEALRAQRGDLVERGGAGVNLAVDPGLPHAAGDELGGLRAEVEDDDRFVHGGERWRRGENGVGAHGRAPRRDRCGKIRPAQASAPIMCLYAAASISASRSAASRGSIFTSQPSP